VGEGGQLSEHSPRKKEKGVWGECNSPQYCRVPRGSLSTSFVSDATGFSPLQANAFDSRYEVTGVARYGIQGETAEGGFGAKVRERRRRSR